MYVALMKSALIFFLKGFPNKFPRQDENDGSDDEHDNSGTVRPFYYYYYYYYYY